ncbi:MAG: hypothetical protein ACYC7D_04825 [Nitrososphaerales archaeon]
MLLREEMSGNLVDSNKDFAKFLAEREHHGTVLRRLAYPDTDP